MRTLRVRHSLSPKGEQFVAVDYDPGGGSTGFTTPVPFTFSLTRQHCNRLRFYMEEFLKYPDDPARENAKALEADMARWGEEMLRQVFLSDRRAQRHYEKAAKNLSDLRIEIQAEHSQAWAIPWEVLRDPEIGYLAVQSQSFVRVNANPAREYEARERPDSNIRILYVICRPRKGGDVPFRSIARPILSAFSQDRDRVQIDVLRPPTFGQLGKVLREALDAGRPYHILHFDGHGVFTDKDPKSFEGAFDPDLLAGGEPMAARGYLVFEDPARPQNCRLVSGDEIGELLVRTKAALVTLNACQSAMARPAKAEDEEQQGSSTGEVPDPHRRDRAYTSLAHEIMDRGAGGVVGMQWVVYVDTAARFVEGFYERLANGLPVGEAASVARADLRNNPRRDSCLGPVDVQDWLNPVVYEASTAPVFAKRRGRLKVSAEPGRGAEGVAECLPKAPEWGFVGRDEVLLELDRAFEEHKVVLLHAFAGSGKTATAREFAVWYWQTGGLDVSRYQPSVKDGPTELERGGILWSSFESYNPMKPFDDFGEAFAAVLERAGVPWGAIADRKKQADVALQVLGQMPILWVWDNVEPVGGWPAGSKSVWSEEEQKFQAGLLRDLKDTRCKVLLTSRRDEKEWLGDIPYRIAVPPMPMEQAVELAAALAAMQRHSLRDLADLRPLLRFSQGNPLTITVLLKEALRQGLTNEEQVRHFVEGLRERRASFHDEEPEGRSASLGASLDYGFRNAFTEEEQKRLALLHLFEGFVQAGSLVAMGRPQLPFCLDEIRGVSRREWTGLLDRAAQAGLLTAHGGGYYHIHPAIPWFFAERFEVFWPERRDAATRAWIGAEARLAGFYQERYENGWREVIAALREEEANLLRGRRLARELGMWEQIISAMQGLHVLYEHTGRTGVWKSLVDEILPDLLDSRTGGPIQGREKEWVLVMGYRVDLAMTARDWDAAEALVRQTLDWTRAQARDVLAKDDGRWTEEGKAHIRTFCTDLVTLGCVRREKRDAGCIEPLKEGYHLLGRIADRAAQAVDAFNLAAAYKDVPALRDLHEAEGWCREALKLLPEGDRLGEARCRSLLGTVFYERFRQARAARLTGPRLVELLSAATGEFLRAVELTPPDSPRGLAAAHNQLGAVYSDVADFERAIHHFGEAVRLSEQAGDVYRAAHGRLNIARALYRAGRLAEARPYAVAALHLFEPTGSRAPQDADDARRLIAQIDEDLHRGPGKEG